MDLHVLQLAPVEGELMVLAVVPRHHHRRWQFRPPVEVPMMAPVSTQQMMSRRASTSPRYWEWKQKYPPHVQALGQESKMQDQTIQNRANQILLPVPALVLAGVPEPPPPRMVQHEEQQRVLPVAVEPPPEQEVAHPVRSLQTMQLPCVPSPIVRQSSAAVVPVPGMKSRRILPAMGNQSHHRDCCCCWCYRPKILRCSRYQRTIMTEFLLQERVSVVPPGAVEPVVSYPIR